MNTVVKSKEMMTGIKKINSDSDIEKYLKSTLVLQTTCIRKNKNMSVEIIRDDMSDVEEDEDDLENDLIYPEEVVSFNNRNNEILLAYLYNVIYRICLLTFPMRM